MSGATSIENALALVTCASTGDVASARVVLANVARDEVGALVLNLAGMCWSSFERLGAWQHIDPAELFASFAAGCQAVVSADDARREGGTS